jgi:preprotein translocase subunit SecG
MNMLETGLLMLHMLVAAGICGFVLLQHGKGADMGAAFGSGTSGILFGAAGSANFLSRTTAILAAVFFASSLGLTWLGATHGAPPSAVQKGLMEQMAPKASDVPAVPGAAPAAAPGAVPATPPAAGAAKVAPPPSPDGSKSGEVPK